MVLETTMVPLLALAVLALTLHLLSKHPGPKLAALTSWYPTFLVSKGDLQEQTLRCHSKYCPIVEIAPNSLSFNSSQSYADIYGVRANARKDERYAGLSVSRRTLNLITCTENVLMRFKRMVHAQFFGSRNLEALQERVVRNVDVFVRGLGSAGKKGGGEVEGPGYGGGSDVDGGWSKPVDLARVTNLAYSGHYH